MDDVYRGTVPQLEFGIRMMDAAGECINGQAFSWNPRVGETFQFNFDTSPGYRNSRRAGVDRARAAGLIGPTDIGHHINSVQTHPHLAPEPSNIAPEPSRASHLETLDGSWRNPTTGPLRPGC